MVDCEDELGAEATESEEKFEAEEDEDRIKYNGDKSVVGGEFGASITAAASLAVEQKSGLQA